MSKITDEILGWIISGIFVVGAYAIARFMLKAEDHTIVIFTIALLWADLARSVNKDDKAKTETPT